MNRVATFSLQRTMADAIQRAQQDLAATQNALATRKKAQNYAALGAEAVRTISARSVLARQDAQATVSKQVATTLAFYDSHVTAMDTSISDLRTDIFTAIGTGESTGLRDAMEATFSQFRNSLNATEGDVPLFAGSRTDKVPFAPETLADAAAIDSADAFRNDDIRAAANVADGRDLTYGITASEVGGQLYQAFQTLAAIGPLGERLTNAQVTALEAALGELDEGLTDLRAVNVGNGRKQNQMEALVTGAEQRSLLFKEIVAQNEDADLGQVAVDLAQQRTVLEASYSVFAQLAGLNLTRFL